MGESDKAREVFGYLILLLISLLLIMGVDVIYSNSFDWTRTQTLETKRLLKVHVPLAEYDRYDLESLPGVGPAIAERIASGDVSTCKDLRSIKGIGEKKFNQLAQFFEECF